MEDIDWKELMPDPFTGFMLKLNVKADVPTLHGRVYPRDVIERACAEARQKLQTGVILVHTHDDADLAQPPTIKTAVGIVDSIHLVDDQAQVTIKLLDSPTGISVRELMNHGLKPSLSMRCVGKLNENLVEDFKIECLYLENDGG